jgi:hypothetical protein
MLYVYNGLEKSMRISNAENADAENAALNAWPWLPCRCRAIVRKGRVRTYDRQF